MGSAKRALAAAWARFARGSMQTCQTVSDAKHYKAIGKLSFLVQVWNVDRIGPTKFTARGPRPTPRARVYKPKTNVTSNVQLEIRYKNVEYENVKTIGNMTWKMFVRIITIGNMKM